MRKINKEAPISSFSEFVTKERPNTWNELHEKGKDVFEETRYHILVEEQNCLCGYTELLITDDKECHIDHFKKRSMFPTETFNWNNLIVASNDERFGAKYKDNVSGIQKSNYSTLLNPVFDSVEDYFYYNSFGQIEPKLDLDDNDKNRAQATIDIFNLSELSLNRKRYQIIAQLKAYKDSLPKEQIMAIYKGKSFPSLVKQYLSEWV